VRNEPGGWIPEPTVFLTGCQPWPPRSAPGKRCPVCGQGVHPGDDHVYCGWSDESSPAREAQIRAARLGLKARDRAQQSEQRARGKLAAKRWPVLTEVERRRIWNGYRKTVLTELTGTEVTNLALTGREFLTAIGQEPDWSKVLDARGKVMGRVMGPSEAQE